MIGYTELHLTDAGLNKSFTGSSILDAEKTGSFDQPYLNANDILVLHSCGVCEIKIDRDDNDLPIDSELKRLEELFSDSIKTNNFYQAAINLVLIHKRAIEYFQSCRSKKSHKLTELLDKVESEQAISLEIYTAGLVNGMWETKETEKKFLGCRDRIEQLNKEIFSLKYFS
jgi:hypothetical protein